MPCPIFYVLTVTVRRQDSIKRQVEVVFREVFAVGNSGQVNTAGCEDEINNNDRETVKEKGDRK